MSKVVVITVPHGACPNTETLQRKCDTLALKAAEALQTFFVHQLGVSVYLLTTKIKREEIDFNRRISRHTPWRDSIIKQIKLHDVNWILDIHSFPNHINSFGTIPINFGNVIPEIVILDSYINPDDNTFLDLDTSIHFEKYLRDHNILVKLMVGGDNDITIEAREIGKRAILIEFNEVLSDSRIHYICMTIGLYFYSIF